MNYWIMLLYLLQINLEVKYFLIFVLSNLIKESNILFYKLNTDLEEWWQSNDFIWHDISEHRSFSKCYQSIWDKIIANMNIRNTIILKMILAWNKNNKMGFLCGGWPHYFLKLPEEGEWRGRCWALPSDSQGHMKMVQSHARGSIYLTLESFSLLSVWSTTGTNFLEKRPMPQCLRDICTMLLTTFFIFWSAMKWSGSWTKCCCRYIPAEILKSRLDYTKEGKKREKKKRKNLNVFVNKNINKYITFFSSRICLELCTAWTLKAKGCSIFGFLNRQTAWRKGSGIVFRGLGARPSF